MKFFLLPLFTIISLAVFGQDHLKTDSLKTRLKSIKNIAHRIEILNRLASETRNINVDSSYIYALEAKILSEKSNNLIELAESYRNIGNTYHIKGNYDLAANCYSKSLNICEKLNDTSGKAICFLYLGNVANMKSDFIHSLDYYQQALIVFEKENNSHKMAVCNINIGLIYYWMKDYEKALSYSLLALEMFEKADNPKYASSCYLNIGLIYICLKDYKKAFDYNKKALDLKLKYNDKHAISDIYNNMGDAYIELNNYDSALYYINKALTIKKELNDKGGIAWLISSLSKIYIKKADYRMALQKNNEGMKTAQAVGDKCLTLEIYDNYKIIYQKMQNFRKAFEYQQNYILLHDSIKGDEIKSELDKSEKQHEIEKLEAKIDLLRKENEFKSKQMAKNKQITWLWITISVLFTFLAIFSFIAYRNKQKMNEILKHQNDEISAHRDYISSQRDIIKAELTETILKAEILQRENLQYKLEALKNQLNPHFLFNTFSTLISLIPENQQLAESYARNLSNVYRYILAMHDNELATIKEELEFINAYMFMISTRFDNKVSIDIKIENEVKLNFIPSFSLQLLVENALKHNIISNKKPLRISIESKGDKILVKNNLQKKDTAENSTGIGLNNIISRYKFFSNKNVDVICSEEEFTVKLPILSEIETVKQSKQSS